MFKGLSRKRKIEAVVMFSMLDIHIPYWGCRTMFQTEQGIMQTEIVFCMN